MKRFLFTLFITSGICFCVKGQLSFTRVDTVQVIDQTLPLKNAWAGGLSFPMFSEIDLNGDSIMDLVIFELGAPPGTYHIMPFLNYGSSNTVDYHYAPQYISRFPPLNYWMVTYDYNNDGKMDIFSMPDSCFSCIEVFRNDYNPLEGLKFTRVAREIDYSPSFQGPSSNIPVNPTSVPVMEDIDGDGDMDIVSAPISSSAFLTYYKGLPIDSGWSQDSLRFKEVKDLCPWGHFILISAKDSATLNYSCAGLFMAKSNWDNGITRNDDTQSCVCIYDQDGDGLKDILVGGYADNNMIFLHNGGTIVNDSMVTEVYQWPDYDVPVNLPSWPCAYHLDVNNDGKKDMIIAPHGVSDFRGILYYKNTHVPTDTFVKQPGVFLQDEMIDVGSGAAPRLFDYDGDGLPDLLIGDESYYDTTGTNKKSITLYKNIGTPSRPIFKLQTRDYAGINANPLLSGNNSVGGICPTFGDLNGDGAPDMIVGLGGGITNLKGNGQLLYFQNTAPAGSPANFMLTSLFYDSIDVGSNAVPQLYDLDHDGLLDLVVGNSSGFIKYYRNIGTISNPIFSRHVVKDTLGGIIIQPFSGFNTGFASPFFYNDSGIDKLIVGTEDGKVYIYDNIMNNIYGSYHLKDSVINGEEGQNLIPYIGDINNDGLPDMLIGNYAGGVSLFLNSFTTATSQLTKSVLPSFTAFPNPASDALQFSFYHTEKISSKVEILNNLGQQVFREAIDEPVISVSVKNFASGIYLARFTAGTQAQSLKIVVCH